MIDSKKIAKFIATNIDFKITKSLNESVCEALSLGLEDEYNCFLLANESETNQAKMLVTAIIEEDDKVKLVLAKEKMFDFDIYDKLKDFISTKAKITSCIERSCGAVLYTIDNNQIKYLAIKNRSLNWGFPKGHSEFNETKEQTALREIKEEVGLDVSLVSGFLNCHNYTVKEFVEKEAIYFLAKFNEKDRIVPQEGEVLEYSILDYQKTLEIMTYEADKNLIKEAQNFIENI